MDERDLDKLSAELEVRRRRARLGRALRVGDSRLGLPAMLLGTRSPTPHTVPTGPPPSSVVAWAHYVHGHKRPADDITMASERALAGDGFVWLGLKDPTNDDLKRFAEQFNLHPLAIEDAVEGHTRSKLEQFGDTLFVVISTIAYVAHDKVTATSEIVSTGQIMIFLGPHFVLTVRKGEQAPLGRLRARMEQDPDELARGPWGVLYAIADKIVDDMVKVVGEMDEDVDEAESRVFARKKQNEVAAVYQLKRELIEYRRTVAPLGGPLQALATRDFRAVPDGAKAYFREIADHHTEAKEALTSLDEVLSSIMSAGLARAAMDDNEDMRKISAWVAIVAVPTLIAGVYGMNFEFIPGGHSPLGFVIMCVLMAALMVCMFAGFKRNRWL